MDYTSPTRTSDRSAFPDPSLSAFLGLPDLLRPIGRSQMRAVLILALLAVAISACQPTHTIVFPSNTCESPMPTQPYLCPDV